MTDHPPVKITNKMLNAVSEISLRLGRLQEVCKKKMTVHLRRNNTLRTIQGTLAIEGNTLSLEQVTAVINGKRVLGTMREVQEVNNAFDLYEHLEEFDPFRKKDLCRAHQILMNKLASDAGHFRKKSVGISRGKEIVHIAPPAENVIFLINNLLAWCKNTDLHPLIAGAVFHYEFEFIHPFSDGNGRLGRFWQTLMLSRWNPLFRYFPIESLISQRQADYYKALAVSDTAGESTCFVELLLEIILKAVKDIPESTAQETTQETTQEKILKAIKENTKITRKQLAELLSLSQDGVKYHLQKMSKAGVIKHIGSTKAGEWVILGTTSDMDKKSP